MYSFGQNVGYKACYYLYSLLATYEVYEIYYTTLLKNLQITSKTSTNIQRYSDSWLFVHLVISIVGNRFDKLTCKTFVQRESISELS